MNLKENKLYPIFLLTIVTSVCGLLLSWVHDTTLDKIKNMEQKNLLAGYSEVYPQFDEIKTIDDKHNNPSIKKIVSAIKNGQQTGIIYNIVSNGYEGEIDMLVGFDIKTKTLTGIKILKQSETPGLGANCTSPKFTDPFAGKNSLKNIVVVKSLSGNKNEINAITAATITSRAIVSGTNKARQHFIKNFL